MIKKFRILVLACMIMIAVFSMLPAHPALAANANKQAEVTVTARNQTNGTVTLRLTDENSYTYWFTISPDSVQKLSVPEGRYSYYASTPCGGQSGDFNLNVSKNLLFSCKSGLEVSLTKNSCQKVLWVGAMWQWFELNPEWWPLLLSNPIYEAEMKCLDSSLPSHFEPFLGP